MGATPSTTPAICRVLLAQRGNTNRFITKNRGWSRTLRRAPREFVGEEGALARPKQVRADPFTHGLQDEPLGVARGAARSERVRRLRRFLRLRVRAYALASEKCKEKLVSHSPIRI